MQPQPQKILSNLSKSTEQQQVGITCYISKGSPIPAITKFMLTDFIVNEITEDGKVVMLKNKPDLSQVYQPRDKKKGQQSQNVVYQVSQQLREMLVGHLGMEATGAVLELYRKLDAGEKVTQWEYTLEDFQLKTKQQRTKFHQFIRQNLINIQSNYLDGNKMKLKLNKKLKKINPASRNKYIHFILFKSNIDTMGAIFRLSKITGINQKLFSTAGLKDKRGVTTQMVSVYNTDVGRLKKFYYSAHRNKEIWIDGFQENMDTDVWVGNLFGNQFGLILRLLDPGHSELIHERVESLRNLGMINYFGMQRFGSCQTKTYMIGLKILKKQWKQVVQDLLLEDTRDQNINILKKQCYQNQQYAKAERVLPSKFKIEKNLFKGLKKHGRNFQNVFESMPRSIRTLYLHSLQSYLWNRMVTRRIKQFGLQVQKGDLVGKKMTGFAKIQAQIRQEKELKQEQNDKKQQQIQKHQEEQDEANIQQINQQQIEDKYQVFIVDQPQKFSIHDIVLPLYGPLLNLPKDSLAEKYLSDQLNQLGINQSYFNQNGKKLCFKGMYRKMIIKPNNVSYKIISHQKCKEQLQSPFYTIGQQLKIVPGQKKAVSLVIQLPKSSYATIVLRELLHIPSSFECQMALNKLYQKQETKEDIKKD